MSAPRIIDGKELFELIENAIEKRTFKKVEEWIDRKIAPIFESDPNASVVVSDFGGHPEVWKKEDIDDKKKFMAKLKELYERENKPQL